MQPPGRVDPRADAEPHVRGGERRLHAGLFDQCLETVRARPGQRLEPEGGDHPVLAVERHQVRDGAQTGHPQQRRRVERLAAPSGQGQRQLEGQPHRRQVPEGIGAARLVGIDVERPRRQLTARQVVIGDDDAHPGRQRPLHRLGRRAAAIRGDDQPAPLRARPLHVDGLEAVPLAQPVRQDRLRLDAAGVEHGEQQRRGRDAVHIVIAHDGHRLLAVAGIEQPGHRLLHAGEQEGIVELIERGLEETLGTGGVLDPPPGQQRRQPRRTPGQLQAGGALRHRRGHPLHR